LVLELEKYNIKNLVLFPESSEKIKKLLSKNYNFIETRDMSEAVKFAFKNT
jgi:UDP-N-acetylmuramoylalanine-D-glutamate ligase